MSAPSEIWSYRHLITNLARRDLRARYKRSVLGWLWSLLNPAATLGIYTVVFGVFLKGQAPALGNGRDGVFALYLFCGLTTWNLFQGIINTSIVSFQTAGPLLTRTYFPPEVPVIAGLLTVLLQSVLELAILMGFMILFWNLSWTVVILIPILALLTLTATGVGLVFAVFNIRYRDVAYLVGILLQVWFYATPIVYPLDIVPDGAARTALSANPLTAFVYAVRQSVYSLSTPTLLNWVTMVLAAAISLTVGWALFSRLAPRVIEEL